MKKLFTLAATLFVAASAVMAQDYSRVQISYVDHIFVNGEDNTNHELIEPKGFNLGVVTGFSVSDNLPIFIEPGINFTWSHSAKDFEYNNGEEKFTYMNVAVPFNGVYKWEINDKIAISGHAGLNFKVNLMAMERTEIEGHKNKTNWLSKSDMGGRDNRANIFQLGGQIGAGVHLQQFYFGWQFQTDFMQFSEVDHDKDHKWNANYLTVGITL